MLAARLQCGNVEASSHLKDPLRPPRTPPTTAAFHQTASSRSQSLWSPCFCEQQTGWVPAAALAIVIHEQALAELSLREKMGAPMAMGPLTGTLCSSFAAGLVRICFQSRQGAEAFREPAAFYGDQRRSSLPGFGSCRPTSSFGLDHLLLGTPSASSKKPVDHDRSPPPPGGRRREPPSAGILGSAIQDGQRYIQIEPPTRGFGLCCSHRNFEEKFLSECALVF